MAKYQNLFKLELKFKDRGIIPITYVTNWYTYKEIWRYLKNMNCMFLLPKCSFFHSGEFRGENGGDFPSRTKEKMWKNDILKSNFWVYIYKQKKKVKNFTSQNSARDPPLPFHPFILVNFPRTFSSNAIIIGNDEYRGKKTGNSTILLIW